tara:strand:+ start:41685 stop:41882 length:198 start_codon:yes stop_codon:yes gene_type:complete
METKKKIAALRAQIAKLEKHMEGAKGQFKDELTQAIAKLQKELDALLAENPHDDGTGRKPIGPGQ